MAEVTGAWIGRPTVVVAKITTGDHSERTDRRERARLGTAQRVLAIAVAYQLAFWTAGQMDVARERVARLAVPPLSIAVTPARIVIPIPPVPICPLPFVAGTTSLRSRVIVSLVSRSGVDIDRVLIPVAIVRTAAASMGNVALVAFTAAAPRRLVACVIVVSRIEIHTHPQPRATGG
jgi:hypothetical protein